MSRTAECRATVHLPGDPPLLPGDRVLVDLDADWAQGLLEAGYLSPVETQPLPEDLKPAGRKKDSEGGSS